jgi:hypothetical protein
MLLIINAVIFGVLSSFEHTKNRIIFKGRGCTHAANIGAFF